MRPQNTKTSKKGQMLPVQIRHGAQIRRRLPNIARIAELMQEPSFISSAPVSTLLGAFLTRQKSSVG